ncbi:acyl-CoA thioesterase-1 [Jannaschia faecimaris]|uniref:Acyl-CoA thioesterase-1 n=1 Tax=Jannaschia faecimaris TaxID=1244108 RepID=A0A1H3N8J9_9RHOB|nr:arylesterase [Jannaschia faecimaris]SDY84805.1 acyl-CoA thioesterase-1 [Jannaschia faecimaris]
MNKLVHSSLAALILSTPAHAETLQVVALGDSLTAGYGLPDGQGFVPQLQAWLDARDVDVEIVNAGVSGDTTAGGLARLDWSLSEDTDAMILALGGNDLLRGLPVASSRANLDAILSRVAGARDLPVLLVGLEAPANYGPDFQQAFDAMYVELSQEYDTLLEPSFLGPLVVDSDMATARASYMQDDGIHPNRDGVGVIVDAFGPRVLDLIKNANP